jgi:hypothetical protein
MENKVQSRIALSLPVTGYYQNDLSGKVTMGRAITKYSEESWTSGSKKAGEWRNLKLGV